MQEGCLLAVEHQVRSPVDAAAALAPPGRGKGAARDDAPLVGAATPQILALFVGVWGTPLGVAGARRVVGWGLRGPGPAAGVSTGGKQSAI